MIQRSLEQVAERYVFMNMYIPCTPNISNLNIIQ